MKKIKKQPRIDNEVKIKTAFQSIPEKVRYLAVSGTVPETYALIQPSAENGGWIVARWGRTNEPDKEVYYLVYDSCTAPEANRQMRSWCTCTGFLMRGDCRHLAIATLGSKL